MLETLDDVDWHELKHAYGPAEDTPAQLRKLLSVNAAEREEAFDTLSYSIYHQGSAYPATAAAVPVLNATWIS
jgi:hypothetical protein